MGEKLQNKRSFKEKWNETKNTFFVICLLQHTSVHIGQNPTEALQVY